MFSRINNKILAIIFIVLLLLVALSYLVDFNSSERTFRSVLVDIDTTAVTQVLIYPKSRNHKEVKLFKEGGSWNVILNNGSTAKVTSKKISDLFQQLVSVKPKRLAAKGEEKWSEFQVDSTGSRVKVLEGDKLTLDLIIGRFSFQQPRSMNTFVRLNSDNDVYEVEGFLDMTFNQGADIFRDGTIIIDDYNSWEQVQFNYAADSSFGLVKNNNIWFVNGKEADSTNTINFLRRLSNISASSFSDDFNPGLSTPVDYVISITTQDLKFIEVKAYLDSNKIHAISSENPSAVLDVTSLKNSLFPGKEFFAIK